jgi:uncharacterized protein YcbK (DUF882 family)
MEDDFNPWANIRRPQYFGSRVTVLHTGQTQQCSHCLRRADSCPGAGVGKVCEKMGTPRGLIGDYMKHLKLQHGYVSLKMKYQQEEFPQSMGKTHLSDGFSHMVETVDNDSPDIIAEVDLDKTAAQDSDTNALYKELMLTKSKLASAEKKLSFADPELNKVAKLSIAANHLDYDETEDTLTVKNEAEFNNFVEQHCQAKSNRPKKIQALKNKVFAQVKVIERRQRGISVSSAGRDAGDKRYRSSDNLSDIGSSKSFRLAMSQ